MARPDTLDTAYSVLMDDPDNPEYLDLVNTLRTHFLLRGIRDERFEAVERITDEYDQDHRRHLDRTVRGPAPVKTEAKAGRNDPCPCGSGKKFKKCCAKKAP